MNPDSLLMIVEGFGIVTVEFILVTPLLVTAVIVAVLLFMRL